MDNQNAIKCINCHKDIAMQEGVKTSKGIICKSCVEKSKKRKALIVASILLLIIAGIVAFYFLSNKNNAQGFDGVTVIQDSTNVAVEKPVEIFRLETAVAQSTPVVAGQTVDNIESFKRTLAQNIEDAKKIMQVAL